MLKVLFLTLCTSMGISSWAAEYAITMDDYDVLESTHISPRDRNVRILNTLKKYKAEAALFVSGKFVQDEKSKALLAEWDKQKHLICNHTHSHDFFGPEISAEQYQKDILKGEEPIKDLKHFRKLFRFPYLAEGDTPAKRDAVRAFLAKNGYKNGYVTIDAMDWFVDARLRDKLKTSPNFDLNKFRDYYLEHVWERAQFVNDLSKQLLGREVKHTLLTHFNLLNALFLEDVIKMFEKRGWKMINASEAFQDPVYNSSPKSSGQGLISALAKETEKFEVQLRYSNAYSASEKEKMDKRGL